MKTAKRILLCLFSLWVLPACAVDLKFDGSVGMRTKYTPEYAWQVEKNLYLTSKIDFGTNIYGTIGFAGLGAPDDWRPISAGNDSLNLTIDRVSLSTKAPFFKKGTPLVTTMGDLELNYSPYALRLDDTIYYDGKRLNPRKRGLAVSDLELPVGVIGALKNATAHLDAALFWDQDSSQRYFDDLCYAEPTAQKIQNNGLVYAANLRAAQGNTQLKLTGVNFDGQIIKPLADTVNTDTYDLSEQALVLELKRNFWKDFTFQFVGGRNWRQYDYVASRVNGSVVQRQEAAAALTSEGDLLAAELGKKIGPWQLAAGYHFLEPQFDPQYRDRTPRYDEEGKRIAWNPIDELGLPPGVIYGRYEDYASENFKPHGKKGGYFKAKLDFGEIKLEGLVDNYRELKQEAGPENSYSVLQSRFTAPFVWNSVAKLTYEQIMKWQTAADGRVNDVSTGYAAFEVTKPLSEGPNSTWDFIGLYEHGDVYEKPVSVTNKGGFLAYSVHSGNWASFKLKVGALAETIATIDNEQSTFIPKISLSYRLPVGVSVLANWARPNRADTTLYDRFGEEYLGEDNVFACELLLEF